MRELFPENAVEYFVSYYDYYQPEAYIPSTDTFIDKDSIINDQIDRMRHSATVALLSRRDVIIVASVLVHLRHRQRRELPRACVIQLAVGEELRRDALLRQLVDIQYERNDVDFHRGTFRVRGDVVEIFPTYEHETAIRIEFFGDEIESIKEVDPLRGRVKGTLERYAIYPGSHYVTPQAQMRRAIESIREELRERLDFFDKEGRFLEKQRLEQRTLYDLEMMEQMGFCSGHRELLAAPLGPEGGRGAADAHRLLPAGLPHRHRRVAPDGAAAPGDVPRRPRAQGDAGRVRLPPAERARQPAAQVRGVRGRTCSQAIYVSATPGEYELQQGAGRRRRAAHSPDGPHGSRGRGAARSRGRSTTCSARSRTACKKNERVLVTTLTKRMAEDLTDYYRELGVRVRYLHSDIDTLERIDILRDLRLGEFDVLVGINLLREGLDLPEVSLVAIFDADKEGFLRSPRSLIQTIGRAARNVNGRVIMYADTVTPAMKRAIDETSAPARRAGGSTTREHGIMPHDDRARDHEHQPGERDDRLPERPQAREGRARRAATAATEPTSRSGSPRCASRCSPPPRTSSSRRPRGCATS